MKLIKAIEILESHNKWRRDRSFDNWERQLKMANPTELGIAIDTVVKHYKSK